MPARPSPHWRRRGGWPPPPPILSAFTATSGGVQAFVTGCTFTKTRSLVALARPHMRHLMEEAGETVNLAVEDDGMAVYLAQIECRQMMRAFARPGSRVPLHCSAVGKAILSGLSDKRLARILHQHGMPRLTVKTIISPTAPAAMWWTMRNTPSGCAASAPPSSTRRET